MFFDRQQQTLAARGRALQDRSAALRTQLAADAQVLRTPLALADQVRRGWHWLTAHPQWVGVGVALLVLWRPRRLGWLAGRLWAGWRLWRRLRRWRGGLGPVATQWLGPLAAQWLEGITGPPGARAGKWRSGARPPR